MKKRNLIISGGVVCVASLVAAFVTRSSWAPREAITSPSNPLVEALVIGAIAIGLLAAVGRRVFQRSWFVRMIDDWTNVQLRRLNNALRAVATFFVNSLSRIFWNRRSKNVKKVTDARRTHLSVYFAQKAVRPSILGAGLILLGFGYSVATRDFYLEGILIALLVAIIVRYWLTTYRANRSYLGTNASEAEELIGFIIKQSKDGGIPPDIRRYSIEKSAEELDEQSITQGAIAGGASR